ncbi:MAG: hypothetical protein ABIK20_00810 [Candidatus Omnitrophota bacterium]
MVKLRDKLWIWGQDPGSHHGKTNQWHLPGQNIMTPLEGACYLGVKNCCRVVMGGYPKPPFDQHSMALVSMNEVVWSAVGDSASTRNDENQTDIDEVIRQAEKFPNITGAVLDDFFVTSAQNKKARHSVESIRNLRDKLHGFSQRKLDLWLVWYEHQIDFDVQDYLDLSDVITFWTWNGSDLAMLDKNIKKVLDRTPGKRRLAGCYMWDYGACKPLTVDDMKFQCEKYYDWIKKGWIEGVVFCSNCICDIGLDTVEWTRNWIAKIGDEEIG